MCLFSLFSGAFDHFVNMKAWTLLLNASLFRPPSVVSEWTLAGGQKACACPDICLDNNRTRVKLCRLCFPRY